MNLSIYGLGDAAPPAMDDRRLRRLVRVRGASAGHRPDVPGYPLSGGGAAQSHRHRADACARGSFRRAVRSVAATEGAGLCDALHRGADRGEASERAGRARNRCPGRGARQPLQCRSVRYRTGLDVAFDSGIERADHPHAARNGASYRRLEARSRRPASACRPIRTSCAVWARRAYSPSSATPPMPCATAARHRKPMSRARSRN